MKAYNFCFSIHKKINVKPRSFLNQNSQEVEDLPCVAFYNSITYQVSLNISQLLIYDIYILIGNHMRTFTISNCQIGSTQSFHKIAAHQKSSYIASLNFNMCGAITFRCSIQFRLNALCWEIFFLYEILEFLKSVEILGIFNIWKILSSKLDKYNRPIQANANNSRFYSNLISSSYVGSIHEKKG